MNFVIEKNIPIRKQGATTFPFQEMETGDSFLIKPNGKTAEKYRCYALNTAKQMGIKVVTRKGDDGIRVWRVK